MPQISKGIRKIMACNPDGLGNTKILTKLCPKNSQNTASHRDDDDDDDDEEIVQEPR